jgi:predicted transcriptional regulator of viral defense system
VNGSQAYAELRELGGPVVRTREAAALWGTDEGNARRRLQSLVRAGLAIALRRGLWALDPDLDPFAMAPYLTAPLPAYVSTFSALAAHAMIEQIPGRVSVVSLGRARRIETALGDFEVHHLAPGLFGGYVARDRGGSVASPEKALFDLVYLRAAAGGRAFLPELSLPEGFERAVLGSWVARIESARLKTIVARRLRQLLPPSPPPRSVTGSRS